MCRSFARSGDKVAGSREVSDGRTERGTLVLVVGPSGVGKDSLIDYCRGRLADDRRFVFPRRSITRVSDGSEDHDVVAVGDFAAQTRIGAFTLHWEAHGLCYGIPASVEADLALGRTVIANVSRGVIDEARRRFPPLIVISVTAAGSVLADRLRQRGRESAEEIARRLSRDVACAPTGDDVVEIDNSGAIATSGAELLSVLHTTVGRNH